MIDTAEQKRWGTIFWSLLGLTLVMLVVMQVTNAPLRNDIAQAGIVSFEFAGSLAASQAIIQSWQGEAKTWASLNMGLDFLFLFLYGSTIALACFLVSERMNRLALKRLGIWLAFGVLFAAALDIVENVALINLLLGSESGGLPILAKWMAIPKFILVLLSLLYVITGMIPALKKP